MVICIGKGVYWTILIVVFGLMQLWVDIGVSLYNEPKDATLYFFVKDGVLLFFTLAVTIGVTLDYFFDDEKSKLGNLWKATAFAFMPIAIMSFVITSYLIFSSETSDPNKISVVNNLNISSFAMALIYATFGKAYLFYKSKKGGTLWHQ
ncbi:hypothetical protein B0F88_104153 [Methylobacter tundripaludum]|uniref:Uncharacterized protein n=1 Tax=Methylobacter tundripaludum TaxID=173365 RepID=A0A2S6H4E0_9GAMM|nr:hypothetical protein [Methylobacter tundripaludum]PPK72359.1 hypothetical protein B0F88_104153 [Methylobacter tundripaludum]